MVAVIKVETEERAGIKNRSSTWSVRLSRDKRILFDSSQVAIRILGQQGALKLGELVGRALENGFSLKEAPSVDWEGDLEDDCSMEWKGMSAHAEHLNGPRRGGIWYSQVGAVFHTQQVNLEPKTGRAARWLCEVVIAGLEALEEKP